jgi:hypothetical protein
MTDYTERRGIPTSKEVLAQQMRDHYDKLKELKPGANLPATPTSGGVPARPEHVQAAINATLDLIAPAQLVGREIQFSKDGKFLTRDAEAEITGDRVFIALTDQTMIGRIRFNGKGEKPDVHMGAMYDGYVAPKRETLGDTDPAGWELGLNGHPQDPWQDQMYLVLQDGDASGELFTFVTRTATGIRAVGKLLRHYERLRTTHPDMYPLVQLKTGGFNHRDTRVGWVTTPTFAVVGKHPKDSTAKPDASPSADLDDDVPF